MSKQFLNDSSHPDGADCRSGALLDLVRSLTEAGDPGEAFRVAQQAQECIATITDLEVKVSRASRLVRGWVRGRHR